MNADNLALRERIYDLVNGSLDLDHWNVPESSIVKNEFEVGSFCDTAYQQMLDAYSRVCRRLSQEEWNDPDIEIIINCLLSIGKHLSFKMFDYGKLFASRE